jgi:hypothetical protein
MTQVLYSFQYERNAALKIFSKLYVGIKHNAGEAPLGFATPYEDNAAGRKRQETVKNWTLGWGQQAKNGELKVLDNELRAGWVITDDIKRTYWGGGNVVWRVMDPLGYELEIQSRNLMALIQTCGLQAGGLIPGKCILARSGGDNVLLHENSEEYQNAIKAAEELKRPANLKTRQPGKLYLMQDGTVALFIGEVHASIVNYVDKDVAEAKVHFPEIDGAKQLRPATAWMYKYAAKPSVKYEAIVRLSEDVNDQREIGETPAVVLYRQASFAKELDEAPPANDLVLNGAPNIARLHECSVFFASSATTAAWVTLSAKPIKNPVLKLRPWTEERWKRVQAAMAKLPHDNWSDYGWWPSAGAVFVIQDQLYSDMGTLGGSTFRGWRRKVAYALPAILEENSLRAVAVNHDFETSFTNTYGGHQQYTSNRYPDPIHARVLEARTPEEYHWFFKQLYNDHAIFDVVVTE